MFRNKLFENKGASMAQERADQEKPHYLRSHNKFINEAVKIEKMRNTPGSTAGAGSGDYHAYRIERRKERYRLAKLDWDANEKREKEKMDALRNTRFLEASNRTLKKALQRMKKRDRKKALKKAKREENAEKEGERAGSGEDGEEGKEEEGTEEEEGGEKKRNQEEKSLAQNDQGEGEETRGKKPFQIQKCQVRVEVESKREEKEQIAVAGPMEGEVKIVVDSD